MWSNMVGICRRPLLLSFCSSFAARRTAAISKGHWIETTWKVDGPKNICGFAISTDARDAKDIFTPQPAFNRAAEKRTDSKWLSEVFANSALVIPVLGSKSLIKDGKPVMLSSTIFPTSRLIEEGSLSKPIFLGMEEAEKPVFAVDISGICSNAGENIPSWLEGTEWVDLRRYGSHLQTHDAGLLAYARGMVEWQTRNGFCGCCGGKMKVKEGGHSLQCSSLTCGNSAYPRLDPAVIMLVSCGDYILLGRQSRWDLGRYSLLAGFVEVGETFETAVSREVQEEAGVKLKFETIKYVASQPWPFPSSLMVGFIAEAECQSSVEGLDLGCGDEVVPVSKTCLYELIQRYNLPNIKVDAKELEDARWIHKGFLKAVLEGKPTKETFSIPGKHAIAHRLMEYWVCSHQGKEWVGNQVPTVEIDEGVFKYVLIQISDKHANQKLIVRGHQAMAYHVDIFTATKEKLKETGLLTKALGGGRIEHDLEERSIHVYGFSQAYGKANHELTVALLQQWFPLHSVTLSWGGY